MRAKFALCIAVLGVLVYINMPLTAYAFAAPTPDTHSGGYEEPTPTPSYNIDVSGGDAEPTPIPSETPVPTSSIEPTETIEPTFSAEPTETDVEEIDGGIYEGLLNGLGACVVGLGCVVGTLLGIYFINGVYGR